MRTTRQRGNTERRVIVTLARHEKHITATEVKQKLNRNKTYHEVLPEFGCLVYYEYWPGKTKLLYFLRPEQFAHLKPAA